LVNSGRNYPEAGNVEARNNVGGEQVAGELAGRRSKTSSARKQ